MNCGQSCPILTCCWPGTTGTVAFCLGGLAVLHAAVRRLSHPTMILVFFYTTAALFGWPFLVVAILGLLESWLGLRRRQRPGSQQDWTEP